MSLQAFKDNLAKRIYGMTAGEAQEKGICIDCKEPALPKCPSETGIREYRISGICEECWNAMFSWREWEA